MNGMRWCSTASPWDNNCKQQDKSWVMLFISMMLHAESLQDSTRRWRLLERLWQHSSLKLLLWWDQEHHRFILYLVFICVSITVDFKLILDFGHLCAQKFVSYQFSTFAGNQSGGRSRADRRKSGGDWNHGVDRGEAAGEGNSLDPREKETRKYCSRSIVQQRERETIQYQVQSPWSTLSIRTRLISICRTILFFILVDLKHSFYYSN